MTIEAHRGQATSANYSNDLSRANGSPPVLARYLTQDLPLHGADPLGTSRVNNCSLGALPLAGPCLEPYVGPIPAVPHLHGAEVLSAFDGHPDAWFTPDFSLRGPAFVTNAYNYVNQQEATTLWFHDHSLGTTRLNVYSGLAGFYLIRDNRDTGLQNNPIGFTSQARLEQRADDRRSAVRHERPALVSPTARRPTIPPGINGPPPNPDQSPVLDPRAFRGRDDGQRLANLGPSSAS